MSKVTTFNNNDGAVVLVVERVLDGETATVVLTFDAESAAGLGNALLARAARANEIDALFGDIKEIFSPKALLSDLDSAK